jgi:hypothetical protein
MTDEQPQPYVWSKVGPAGYQVSSELLADAMPLQRYLMEELRRTPEERRQRAEKAARERAMVREMAVPVPLTLDVLVERLGWSRAYAEHFEQPDCECSDSADGWMRCPHAYDLDLEP